MEPGGIGGVMIGLGLLVLLLGTFVSRDQDAEAGPGGVITFLGLGLIIVGFFVAGGFPLLVAIALMWISW